MLAYRLAVLIVQIRELLLDDLAHPHLSQLLGDEFLIKQSLLQRWLVLHEGRDQFVQVLPADSLRLLAFRLDEYDPVIATRRVLSRAMIWRMCSPRRLSGFAEMW